MSRNSLRAIALTALVVVCASGCGGGDSRPDRRAADETAQEPRPEPGFDPLDPRYDTLAESAAAERKLLARAGHRRDYRVPRSLLAGLGPGPLAHTAVVRISNEIAPDDARYRRLNPGQRALFALMWADAEILNGGFDQFLFNDTGYLAPDLAEAARRVGSGEYAAVFADLERLFPAGRIPRDRAERERLLDAIDARRIGRLDERYTAFQYHRRTSLGVIPGRYVRAHMSEFAAG
jgi:hypothetical protein